MSRSQSSGRSCWVMVRQDLNLWLRYKFRLQEYLWLKYHKTTRGFADLAARKAVMLRVDLVFADFRADIRELWKKWDVRKG